MHINDAGNKRRYLGVAPREAPRQACCQQLLLTPPAEKEVHTATATRGGKCGMLMWQKNQLADVVTGFVRTGDFKQKPQSVH